MTMESKLKRQLGVFGPSNSGKTSFWACLYGGNGQPDQSVSFVDMQTVSQLDAIWKSLVGGDATQATALGEPSTLVFNLHSKGITWTVSTKDYPGTLVELAQLHGRSEMDEQDGSHKRIAEWILGCDALLVLLPADIIGQDRYATLRYRRELEVLLDSYNRSHHPVPLPVCLAVTKSDILTSWSTLGSPTANQDRAEPLPFFVDEILDLVRNQMGEGNVHVFFTSAFGKHSHDDPHRPSSDLQPKGLEPALEWAMQQSDRRLFRTAEDQANRSLSRPFLGTHRKALKICKCVASKGLPDKMAEDLTTLQARLAAASRKQRWQKAICVAIVVIALIIALTTWHAASLAQHAQDAMATNQLNPQSVSAVREFVGTANPIASIWYRDTQQNANKWYEEKSTETYDRIIKLLDANYDPEELHWQHRRDCATRRVEICDDFLDLFPYHDAASEIRDRRVKARKLKEDLEKYGPFDDDFRICVTKIEDAPEASMKRELAKDFSHKYPEKDYPYKRAEFDRIRSRVDEATATEEVRGLKKRAITIQADYDKAPTEYSGHLTSIARWFTDYEKARRQGELQGDQQRLVELRGIIERNWDRKEYERLKGSAGHMYDGLVELTDAIKNGEDYLQAAGRTIAMRAYVEDWLAYTRALKAERRIGVSVERIFLDDTPFDDFGEEHIQVIIRIKKAGAWATLVDSGKVWINDHKPALMAAPKHVTMSLASLLNVQILQHDNRGDPDEGDVEFSVLKWLKPPQKLEDSVAIVLDIKEKSRPEESGALVEIVLTGLPKIVDLPSYPAESNSVRTR